MNLTRSEAQSPNPDHRYTFARDHKQRYGDHDLAKSCPRCTGDLRYESDSWGEYTICVHCGEISDLTELDVSIRPVPDEN